MGGRIGWAAAFGCMNFSALAAVYVAVVATVARTRPAAFRRTKRHRHVTKYDCMSVPLWLWLWFRR